MIQKSHPRITVLLITILVLILTSSCTSQEISSDKEDTLDTDSGSSRTETYPGYLGFVDDPAGEPVALALVGGTERSTWDGVASGEFKGYEGKWIPVESTGYATGFAYLFPEEDDFQFFVTTLTPFQSLIQLEAGEVATLYGSHEEELVVTVEISDDKFDQTPAFFGLTAIDPLDVKSRYANTELAKGLRVQQAVAVQAFDETWTAVDLAAGETVTVRFEFTQPLSTNAVFAIFDPNDGIWRALEPACTVLDPNTYTCELSSLTPLLAVFDFPPEPAAFNQSGLQLSGFTLGSQVLSNPFLQEGGVGGGGNGLDGIYDQIEDWLKQQEEESGGFDPNDPVLKDLIEKLIEEALKEAAKNRNESGKKTLVLALGLVTALSADAGAALEAEMAKISDEIGEAALKESDCGEFERLYKAAEQIERTKGSSMELHDKLIKKAQEMVKDCDLWDGDITVLMRSVSAHPAGLPMSGGGGTWTEIHKVKIWTNVDDKVMHGESKVTYSFPTVKYIRKADCPSVIEMSGVANQTTIKFEGTYDGYAFQVNSVTTEGGTTIKQHWIMRIEENEECDTVLDTTYSFSQYYSLIVHGVSSDSPPINIQEILDTGAAEPGSDGLTRFNDNQSITNPEPDLGIYPFLNGSIRWYFFHTEKKLPLEQKN
jgi:hypothetical protein